MLYCNVQLHYSTSYLYMHNVCSRKVENINCEATMTNFNCTYTIICVISNEYTLETYKTIDV